MSSFLFSFHSCGKGLFDITVQLQLETISLRCFTCITFPERVHFHLGNRKQPTNDDNKRFRHTQGNKRSHVQKERTGKQMNQGTEMVRLDRNQSSLKPHHHHHHHQDYRSSSSESSGEKQTRGSKFLMCNEKKHAGRVHSAKEHTIETNFFESKSNRVAEGKQTKET